MNAALVTAAAMAVPALAGAGLVSVVAVGVVEAWPARSASHLKPRVPERPEPVRDSTVPIRIGGQR